MLGLHVCVGESLLADGLWELRLIAIEGGCCRLSFTSAKIVPCTVNGPSGSSSGSLLRADQPFEFTAGYGSRIMIGQSKLVLWPYRKDHGKAAVKFMIEAPREIRFSRPSQHGGSLKPV